MKTTLMCAAVLATAIPIALATTPAAAQRIVPPDTVVTRPQSLDPPPPSDQPVLFRLHDLSGPRVGATFAFGDGKLSRDLDRKGLGRIVSQFGWHFERELVPIGAGPELVTEAVPMFGGVEYGKLIPSLTMAVGVRFRDGLEFGMGPSFTLVNTVGRSNVGLVVAVGKTFDYDGVSLPVNIALSTNPQGTRTTLTAGYAIRTASR
jgi:hypothetical protein